MKKMKKLFSYIKTLRGEMKKSRFKIWLRAFLLIQFSVIFMIYFFRDIGNGYFRWEWVAVVVACFIPIGFLLSSDCPHESEH